MSNESNDRVPGDIPYSLSRHSDSTASTVSQALEHLDDEDYNHNYRGPYRDTDPLKDDPLRRDQFEQLDVEDTVSKRAQPLDTIYRRWLIAVGIACVTGWTLALILFLISGSYRHRSTLEHDPHAIASIGSGKRITMEQLQHGAWYAQAHSIRWVEGPNGEDGRLLEIGSLDKDFVVVESIQDDQSTLGDSITLMKTASFQVNDMTVRIAEVWPSPDLKTVLILSDRRSNWRHSFTGLYWLYDVATGRAQALDPEQPLGRVQLAQWSPTSNAVVFTRDNNLYLRNVDFDSTNTKIIQITSDGGEQVFNGVPDWVYEEEVFAGNSVTWLSEDGNYIAFLRTNESRVAEYPVQYFFSRPSGTKPAQGMENYPEVRQIKYPKAGTPNPIVHLRFYDVRSASLFDVPIEHDFSDDDRLITEVVWAGGSGKILVRETNRESDFLKMVLIDVDRRQGSIVRSEDIKALDGGWFEVSETTTFVPADPNKGRPHHGYIDTVVHNGFDHLAYFAPLDSSQPKLVTSGDWEVVSAPSAVDLEKNLVYFVATKEGSTQRHVYSVKLDGTQLEALTDTNDDGYYEASFSKGAGYVLLSYQGPHIPWQKVISTRSHPGGSYSRLLEDNKRLAQLASASELPLKVYSTINIDGFELNVLERRPPHFSDNKKYPVLFFLYGGPGSQQVDQKFKVDFQSYVASTLGYIVVTVDGRGTGYVGRKSRCIIRGNIGHFESHDQIATAKEWAKKKYVDASRMAIWGWSYGGYLTLKTLEEDAGQTFSYGMAVAPVTNWLYYDSIYTERWLLTPQNNPDGYEKSAVTNVTALGQNTRFLVMHGVADDNVHMQSTLALLDKLNLAQVENYDVHVFPDSDHSIYFHNANRIVYDKLSWWLVNAFNGEWARLQQAVPNRLGS